MNVRPSSTLAVHSTAHAKRRPAPLLVAFNSLIVLGGIVVLLTLVVAARPSSATAQESGTLTIRMMGCPQAIADRADLYELCYDFIQSGVTVHYGWGDRGNQYTAVTDSSGYVSFPIDPGDIAEDPDPNDDIVTGGVYVSEEMPAGYTGYAVYCSSGGEAVPVHNQQFEINNPDFAMVFVEPGTDVNCDWYNVPAWSQVPAEDTGDESQDTDMPVAQLPDTGGVGQPGQTADGVFGMLAPVLGLAGAVILARALRRQRRVA